MLSLTCSNALNSELRRVGLVTEVMAGKLMCGGMGFSVGFDTGTSDGIRSMVAALAHACDEIDPERDLRVVGD